MWKEMFKELYESRELTWLLFIRDFKARYKQTLLGVAWAVIMPVVAVGTFAFLNQSGVLSIGDVGVPYVLYALVGLTTWQLFAGGIVACTNSIVLGGSMVVKINFPKETLVISSFGQTLIEFLVRAVMIALLFLYYGILPAPTIILYPLAILPILLFTLGLGLLLSLMNAIFRDIANIVTMMATFLMFITPVLYPAREGYFAKLSAFNPLAAMVELPRDLILTGNITHIFSFAWASVLSILVFLLCWRVFHLAEIRIAERVGAR